MKPFLICSAAALALATVTSGAPATAEEKVATPEEDVSVDSVEPNVVFRYAIDEDKDSEGYHFMEGEPGVKVNGGYKYVVEDVPYVLNYVADAENGYVPESELIPQAPVDTEAVSEAKTQFYAAFDAMEDRLAKVAEAEDSEGEKVMKVDDEGVVVHAVEKRQTMIRSYAEDPAYNSNSVAVKVEDMPAVKAAYKPVYQPVIKYVNYPSSVYGYNYQGLPVVRRQPVQRVGLPFGGTPVRRTYYPSTVTYPLYQPVRQVIRYVPAVTKPAIVKDEKDNLIPYDPDTEVAGAETY